MRKKFLTLACAAVACTALTIGLSACSGLDDDEKANNNGLRFMQCTDETGNAYLSVIGFDETSVVLPSEVVIPDTYNDVPVKEIAQTAFMSNKFVQKVTIGANVTDIQMGAFAQCTALTEIVIPDSVTELGESAFYNCTELKTVTIGKGVTCIAERTFANCSSLKNLTLGASVAEIESYAFSNCLMYSVTLPASLKTLDSEAFEGCQRLVQVVNLSALSEETVQAGVSVPYIVKSEQESKVFAEGEYTFIGVDREGNAKEYALLGYDGTATELTLPNGVKESKYSVFRYAFIDQDEITSVTIPANVSRIAYYAFENCSKLTSFTLSADLESASYIFGSSNDTLSRVTISEGVTKIPAEIFARCWAIEEITVPASVTEIYLSSLYDCTSLKSITFMDTAGWSLYDGTDLLNSIEASILADKEGVVTALNSYSYSETCVLKKAQPQA